MPIAVVTGGPGSGKSAVLRGLRQRGLRVMEEAAAALVQSIQDRVGADAEREWRVKHRCAFQALVVARQKRLEQEIGVGEDEWVVAERGLLDGLAYCIEELAPVPWQLMKEIVESRPVYEAVFLLEVLPRSLYAERPRAWTRDQAVSMGRWCQAVYRAFGYPVQHIAFDSVDRRCDVIVQHLGMRPNIQRPPTCIP